MSDLSQTEAVLVAAAVARQIDGRFLRLECTSSKIDWNDIARELGDKTQRAWQPVRCQRLWRWAAYGQAPPESSTLYPDSDGEDDIAPLAAGGVAAPATSSRRGAGAGAGRASEGAERSACSVGGWPSDVAACSFFTEHLAQLPISPADLTRLLAQLCAAPPGSAAPSSAVASNIQLAVEAIVGPPPPKQRSAARLHAEWLAGQGKSVADMAAALHAAEPGVKAEFKRREAEEDLRVMEATRRYKELSAQATRLLTRVLRGDSSKATPPATEPAPPAPSPGLASFGSTSRSGGVVVRLPSVV